MQVVAGQKRAEPLGARQPESPKGPPAAPNAQGGTAELESAELEIVDTPQPAPGRKPPPMRTSARPPSSRSTSRPVSPQGPQQPAVHMPSGPADLSAGGSSASETEEVEPPPFVPEPAGLSVGSKKRAAMRASRSIKPTRARDQRRKLALDTRYLGFPLWAWLTLVAATLIAAVGLGIAIWPGPAGGPEQAVAKRPESPPGFEEPDVLAQGGRDSDRGLPSAGSSRGQTTPGSRPPTSSEGESSSPTSRPPGPQFEMEFAPPKVAKSLEGIKDAIVKLVVPLPDGEETGTGFLIDGRGWVATNYHVIEHANVATKAVLANGMECRLAGVLAKAPEYDLAILQLAERPYQLTILDISYDGKPKLGAEVFAYGHPYDVDFSLSKGIVSRIVTTGELEDSEPDHLVTEINSPAATEWIQHTAKISPGNSGGPLLDANAEVLGVNTFVHMAAEYGFAIARTGGQGRKRFARAAARGADSCIARGPLSGQASRSDGGNGRGDERAI